MNARRIAPLLVAAIALVGCGDLPVTVEEAQPVLAIDDGAHGGNPHFFFLTPLVPAPDPTGTFDGTLSPEVEICPLDPVLGCGAPIAIFTTDAGSGSETVRVSTADEHYIVNWHSKDFDLDEDVTYRIRIFAEGRELGYGDVDVVSSGNELRNVATDEYIALKDGRTLPIKFRIEEGAIAAGEVNVFTGGGDHACALDSAGQAFCWGSNDYGQLGNGTLTDSPTPTAVAGGLTFQSIKAGHFLTCGVTTGGDGYCWGYNQWGQVGTGTAGGVVTTPTQIVGGQSWLTLAPAFEFVCGLNTAGEAWCWGNNSRGTLGRGFFSFQEVTPAPAVGGLTFETISGFRNYTCAVTDGGDGYCWGGNFRGGLGDGTFSNQNAPTAIVGGLTFASVDAGLLSTCGQTVTGAGYCWGQNDFGELGTGTATAVDFATPQAVTGGHVFQDIKMGFGHACGVTTSGVGLCWGLNGFGQLGIGAVTGIQPTPQPVTGPASWVSIDAARSFTCGQATDGDIYCWGSNAAGAVGDGSGTNTPTPVQVFDPTP